MKRTIDITADQHKTLLALLERYLPNTAAWVYSSRVKWTSRPQSDLDLVVFAKSEQERRVSDLREAFEESSLPFRVDLFVWDSVPEQFHKQIEADHVVLAEKKERGVADGWPVKTVKQLVEECIVERPMDGNHGEIHPKSSDFLGEGIPFIMASDVSGGRVDTKNCAFISENQARSLRKGFSITGDVLISHKATMGRTAIVGRLDVPFIMLTPQVTYYRIRDKDQLEPKYLKSYFDSPAFQQLFKSWGQKGSTRSYLGITSQLDLPIVVPPPDVQKSIAHILGALDDKIELNRRMNETLEAMARALFKSWFVDFDPVRAKMEGRDTGLPQDLAGLFPDRLVDSELGEIPEGWEVGVLDDVIEIHSGGTPKTSIAEYWDGDIPWYTAKDAPSFSDMFVLETERMITEAGVENSAAKVLPARTTVITARGTVGRLACLGRQMAMNQTCYGIRGAHGYPDLFTYLNIKMTVDELQRRTHGTIFDTITRQTFKTVETVLPPTDLAKTFESAVNPVMERILNNLYGSRTLATLRDALLPKLVSGKLQVPSGSGTRRSMPAHQATAVPDYQEDRS